ncbi:MAG: response regulator [Spirochaetaceae bacterium]
MILVVDDTPENIDILLEILGEVDDLSVALSGEDALEIVEDETPDLIVLDVVMPGMDGYTVCKTLKANDKYKDIPIIFLSGNDSAEEVQKGLDLGAVDFQTKPIDPEKLIAAINKYKR